MEQLRRRIETIRGLTYRLSPAPEFTPPPPAEGGSQWMWGVVSALAGAIVVFLLYKLHHSWQVEQVEALLSAVK
jgi:hypothetical protein